MPLLRVDDKGIYCSTGAFHIDPWRPVEVAVITHGHADHARAGAQKYLCHFHTAEILRVRLGNVCIETVDYGETVTRNGVRVSLHPAGHVLGSAQVRLESGGEVWVASGDYKTEPDGVSAPFVPLRCDVFITESTFGLPLYRWRPQGSVFEEINAWWRGNAREGRASLLGAYSLGKAQRILAHLDEDCGPIVCHGAIDPINEAYRRCGVALPHTQRANELDKTTLSRALVIAPPSAFASPWVKRFGDYSDAFVSGWMQIRGNRRRRGVDRGFVLSDHADWPGLLDVIRATGASRILITHGGSDALARYLGEKGFEASALATEYGNEWPEPETVDAPESDA